MDTQRSAHTPESADHHDEREMDREKGIDNEEDDLSRRELTGLWNPDGSCREEGQASRDKDKVSQTHRLEEVEKNAMTSSLVS